MMDLVEYYFLDQVVKEPTREEAILDLFFTNTGSVLHKETTRNLSIADVLLFFRIYKKLIFFNSM